MRHIRLLPLCNFLQVNKEICTCYRFVTFCNYFFAITHVPQHGALPWIRASARRCLCLFSFQRLCALIDRGWSISVFFVRDNPLLGGRRMMVRAAFVRSVDNRATCTSRSKATIRLGDVWWDKKHSCTCTYPGGGFGQIKNYKMIKHLAWPKNFLNGFQIRDYGKKEIKNFLISLYLHNY